MELLTSRHLSFMRTMKKETMTQVVTPEYKSIFTLSNGVGVPQSIGHELIASKLVKPLKLHGQERLLNIRRYTLSAKGYRVLAAND